MTFYANQNCRELSHKMRALKCWERHAFFTQTTIVCSAGHCAQYSICKVKKYDYLATLIAKPLISFRFIVLPWF